MNNWITTQQMPWLERYLDLTAFRQRLVANNLANIDTPGFAAQDIDFEREMLRAIERENLPGLVLGSETQPVVHDASGLAARPDGNNVSVDRESALLAETQIRFQLGTQLLRRQFQAVRSAIQEGRGI